MMVSLERGRFRLGPPFEFEKPLPSRWGFYFCRLVTECKRRSSFFLNEVFGKCHYNYPAPKIPYQN
jgi:hypothetical protein